MGVSPAEMTRAVEHRRYGGGISRPRRSGRLTKPLAYSSRQAWTPPANRVGAPAVRARPARRYKSPRWVEFVDALPTRRRARSGGSSCATAPRPTLRPRSDAHPCVPPDRDRVHLAGSGSDRDSSRRRRDLSPPRHHVPRRPDRHALTWPLGSYLTTSRTRTRSSTFCPDFR